MFDFESGMTDRIAATHGKSGAGTAKGLTYAVI